MGKASNLYSFSSVLHIIMPEFQAREADVKTKLRLYIYTLLVPLCFSSVGSWE